MLQPLFSVFSAFLLMIFIKEIGSSSYKLMLNFKLVPGNYLYNGFFIWHTLTKCRAMRQRERRWCFIYVVSLSLHWRIKAMVLYIQHCKQLSQLVKCWKEAREFNHLQKQIKYFLLQNTQKMLVFIIWYLRISKLQLHLLMLLQWCRTFTANTNLCH